ncbi:NAD-dependent succinate-semialdehyde dehydrogenase [Sphingosinicella soli]|uniref:Succinate-semialdehyde dehydrogenase/glutarate-semialdehyde dehydrogenase n=1 Tax=Sphingosinicella soli TaxID=333708 RepID=A0A7W7B3P5_9SPHN|nr:NAD-dependent succinate-semialdehyde dehydrogenase [Sphingosinicella soli]MBB4633391.1 succinate-semialdehyde dehydrogenase/glutarate-semialdehyde dehydrogenase [Sphingosinicella soli]
MVLQKQAAFVAGRWIAVGDRPSIVVDNPCDGSELGRVPSLGRAAVREAIEAAVVAQASWRHVTAKERSAVLRHWFSLIMAQRDALAALLTAEQGKPIGEALAEIDYAAAYVEWFAEQAKRVEGDIPASHRSDRRILVLKQPVGVVAAITPWNFPAAMVTRKLAPALAAGCAVVLKPAPQTPFSALALAYLAEQAGLPPGLLSVLTGPAEEIGWELTSHPQIRKLTFTGSTATGRSLIAATAGTVKRLSLELGGNAPFIVFEDADIDAAVDGAIESKFRNAGQTCVCPNRLLVHDMVHDAFVERLVRRVAAFVVGPGREGPDIGPLIDQHAIAKVEAHVADALSRGARLMCGGSGSLLGANYFEPTILCDVTADMLVAREETFGPVAAIMRFASDEDAIALANDTEAGLASYFYTRDMDRLFRIGEALDFGMVGVNSGAISTEVAPFGGIKQSGFGREGSRHGIEDYLDIKYLCVGPAGPKQTMPL